MPSNKFHLNEVRIDRSELDKFPVLIAEGLGLSQRHAFLLQRKIAQVFHTPAISFSGSLATILTDELTPSDYWGFLDSEDLKGYTRLPTTFGRQTLRTRRRLLSAILGYHSRQKKIFQEGFLDFYEYTSDSSVFHSSLSITVLEDSDYYRLFLEPGFNVLYPLDSLAPELLVEQRLRVLEIPPSDADQFGGGFLGFLVSIEEASTVNQEEELILLEVQAGYTAQFARLKRTRRSKSTYLVPSQCALVRPSYEMLAQRGHLGELRDRTLLRPPARLQQLRNWGQKLFPNNLVSIGSKLTAKVRFDFSLMEPTIYDGGQDLEPCALFYRDNPLKFGLRQPGNIEITDPYKGIRNYGPWDLRAKDQPRPVSSIRPYIIRPKDYALACRLYHLFEYFRKGGYTEGVKASRWDRSFRGFKREFKAPFQMPSKEDAVPDCETDEEYLDAADTIIEKWAASDGDPSRIALVVFPFDQEDSLEDSVYSKELYPRLKQKFIQAGLPSHMIDRSTLEQIQFKDGHPRIKNARLSFDEQSFFGHILWNLALNIYVKLGGRPWTLQRELGNVNCLIGLSFTVNTLRPERPMYVGIANIFDEFGEWLDITPDQRQLSNAELKAWYENPYLFYSQEAASSKLPREFTAEIVQRSVRTYKNRRGSYPLNIVIHKAGTIHQVEIRGVLEGIQAAGIPLSDIMIGFVSLIQNHNFRMYGEADDDWWDNFVVRRGVMCPLEADRAVLATTGRTESSSHKIGTPQPLEVRVQRPLPEVLENVGLDHVNQYSVAQLCEQLMALTQLHWGSMRKEIKLPVTILYSQKVASLSARAEIAALPKGHVHRPWFI
jgi:hypothetical protein